MGTCVVKGVPFDFFGFAPEATWLIWILVSLLMNLSTATALSLIGIPCRRRGSVGFVFVVVVSTHFILDGVCQSLLDW